MNLTTDGMSCYSMIAAVSETHRVIGKDNDLLWKLPKDMSRFRSLTMGKPIIMGRKTFESIGTPLRGRKNVVITRDPTWTHKGVWKYQSIHQAFAEFSRDGELMIIGGSSIYWQYLHLMDRLYLTIVHDADAPIEGDATFPDWEDGLMWKEESRCYHAPDERHAYGMTFLSLQRRWLRSIE